MNERERYIATLRFGRPDRIPFSPGGPRESTLKAWRQQGLPAGASWLAELKREIGIPQEPPVPRLPALDVDFRLIPQFEETVLERKPGTLVVQDWKGNVCEISDRYDVTYLREAKDFVTRKWIRCPVESRDDWERMKTRYVADAPARFPADFDDRCRLLRDRTRVLGLSISGPFWQLREWLGFEGLCMAFLDQPDMVRDMIAFWERFVSVLLERTLDRIVPDTVCVNEDMAYKEKAMISPAMVREFILPTWTRWGRMLTGAGCPVYRVDSDGFVGELIPLWIEAGFAANEPQEVAAGNDLPAYRRTFGTRMAYLGGVDKRAMARGGAAIRTEIGRLMPAIRAGGCLPGCDHGIPSDVSWPCMVEYGRLLAEATGWI